MLADLGLDCGGASRLRESSALADFGRGDQTLRIPEQNDLLIGRTHRRNVEQQLHAVGGDNAAGALGFTRERAHLTRRVDRRTRLDGAQDPHLFVS